MPMTGPGLTTFVKGKITSKNPAFDPNIGTDMDWLIEAICEGVVEYIQANAQVNTTVAVASVGGVTTGPSASGPGTGTGSGTIA
jgi:hypothetical protein